MSLIKPNLQTRFQIDFEWWRQSENDWHVHLHGLLCPEHQERFANFSGNEMIDFIDPKTAEVRPMDGLQHVILAHCAQQPGFITSQTQLVEAVFRTFFANGNNPLSPVELSERLNRPANTILITLSGPRIYHGLRPVRG